MADAEQSCIPVIHFIHLPDDLTIWDCNWVRGLCGQRLEGDLVLQAVESTYWGDHVTCPTCLKKINDMRQVRICMPSHWSPSFVTFRDPFTVINNLRGRQFRNPSNFLSQMMVDLFFENSVPCRVVFGSGEIVYGGQGTTEESTYSTIAYTEFEVKGEDSDVADDVLP